LGNINGGYFASGYKIGKKSGKMAKFGEWWEMMLKHSIKGQDTIWQKVAKSGKKWRKPYKTTCIYN
jgi:hypothetical protein